MKNLSSFVREAVILSEGKKKHFSCLCINVYLNWEINSLPRIIFVLINWVKSSHSEM